MGFSRTGAEEVLEVLFYEIKDVSENLCLLAYFLTIQKYNTKI
jgi:hypothetical protein